MTDKTESLKRRALRAAKAVTLSAAFVGAAACSDEGQTGSNNGWDVGGEDATDTMPDTSDTSDTSDPMDTMIADTSDTVEDTAVDTGDVIEMDVADTVEDTVADTRDTVANDASVSCSPDFDDVCPDSCNASNDADCCEKGGGSWSKFADAGACAVPGPFVPPALLA